MTAAQTQERWAGRGLAHSRVSSLGALSIGGFMEVGRYIDGRPVNYDEASHVFDVGGTRVALEDIAGYDRAGQIDWLSDDLRDWARGLPGGGPTSEGPTEGEAEAIPQRKRGRLLGFRSHVLWKMILASVYYGLCAIMLIGVFQSVKPYASTPGDVALDVVSYLIMILAIISPALLLSDLGYRDMLPLFRRRKWALSALGLATVFLALVGASAFADSLHTAPYKTAAKQESLAQEKKRDSDEARAIAQSEARKAAARAAEESGAAQAKANADAKRAEEASRAAEAARIAEAKKAAEQAATAAAAKADLERQKAAVIRFEKDVYAAEAPAQSAIKTYQREMQRFSKGQASIYDVYGAATDAKSACESVRRAYWDLDIPEGLPDDVTSLLKEVTSSLSTAYGVKAEAFGAVMEFLDSQKPSSMQEFKDKIVQADSFTLEAVAKLFQAKEKLGIPLTSK